MSKYTKQQIIDAICQTAQNGKPLGQGKFEKETGVGYYDWGEYWPRFSCAQQEAGFEPNHPYIAYDDEYLIKKIIAKIRKFGKYPTQGELRVEQTKDVTFPYNAIKKRGKSVILNKIVEYCNKKRSYKDILGICKPIIEKNGKQVENKNTQDNFGIYEVYLIKSGRYYKIGKTKDTFRRGEEIKIQLPETIELIYSIKTDDPTGVELYWHKRFENKRMKGERFDLTPVDVKAFKRWKCIV